MCNETWIHLRIIIFHWHRLLVYEALVGEHNSYIISCLDISWSFWICGVRKNLLMQLDLIMSVVFVSVGFTERELTRLYFLPFFMLGAFRWLFRTTECVLFAPKYDSRYLLFVLMRQKRCSDAIVGFLFLKQATHCYRNKLSEICLPNKIVERVFRA